MTKDHILEIEGLTLSQADSLRMEVVPILRRIGVKNITISLWETAASADTTRPPLTLLRPGERITVRYTNWRGETAVRHIEIDGHPHWGNTQWHPEFQWLVTGSDLDRPGESRVWAVKDMEPVT